MTSTEPPVVVEQTFDAPAETVWKAITELDQMKKWYFEPIPAFKAKVGFETKFNIECNGRNFKHLWKVTEVEPQESISYNWSYEGYEGDSNVKFELATDGKGCRLKLTHTTTKDWPSDIPEFTREACTGGWNYFIKGTLPEYISKGK